MRNGRIRRRLEDLERRDRPSPERRAEVRERIRRSLDRLAAWRRGDLPDEEAAEVEAEAEAVRRRLAEIRGEGGS